MQIFKSPADILVYIIENLRRTVTDEGFRGAFTMICRGYASMRQFAMRLNNRIGRINRRFERLVKRLETEAPKPFPPARRPRGTAPKRAPRVEKVSRFMPAVMPPWDPENPTYPDFRPVAPTPPKFAWLRVALKHHTAADSQMQHLFTQPEMRALLASDYRFGRILRPLCHMLGVRLPPELRPREPLPVVEESFAEPRNPSESSPDSAHSHPTFPALAILPTLAPSGARNSLPDSHPEPRGPPLKPA